MQTGPVESVQDFLWKLAMKPHIHLVEIIIFSNSISGHRQTYQNYEQSQQKLGTILENKYLKNQNFQKKIF